MKKFAAAMAVALSLAVLGLTGCAQSGAKTSTEATAENPMVLTLAHGLSETHTVHIAMTEFADKVEERTNGRIQVRILPNGQLGSENENMEQLMAGVISMTKVSAPGLATYNESYHAFGLPYIFDDTEDFYHVMDSDPMQDFFLSSSDDGFVTLTYYTSGARSFYTKNKAIRTPAAFTEELVRYFLIWTGFIGAAYAFITREHMCLVLVRDSLSPAGRRILMTVIDVLILLFAVFVITIGGFKLALSAQKVFSALLGIPRSLVYAMAPISGLFIILAQIINIYEDVTGITIEGGNE